MTPSGAFGKVDRFRMREVERRLTAELYAAQEQQRYWEARIRDQETNRVEQDPQQALSLTELRTRYLEATHVRNTALQRFVDFATHGNVPQDLDI
jgi:hypothetical protein